MSVLRRDFKPWLESLQPERSPVGDRVPWLTFGAQRHLQQASLNGLKVFEYGSGGSSLFFLDRGCTVTTIDHDREWLERVRDHIRPGTSWTPRHEPPTPAVPGDDDYRSWFPRYRGLAFKKYAHALEDYPRGHFDVVLVDGRARAPCLALASRRVADDGIVILDNSERPRYAPAISELERAGWHAVHFHGPGPYVRNEFWNTTLFTRHHADAAGRHSSASLGRH